MRCCIANFNSASLQSYSLSKSWASISSKTNGAQTELRSRRARRNGAVRNQYYWPASQ
jgi:hypothetical protein